MTRCDHPVRPLLAGYVLREIDPAQRAAVEVHLTECPDCRRNTDKALAVMATIVADGMERVASQSMRKRQ